MFVTSRCAARRRSSPFLTPAQPLSVTVLTSCPRSCSRNVRGTHSSSSTRIRDQMPLGQLERRDSKVSWNRWEVVEKPLQSVPALDVIDQRLHRDPGTDEDRRSPQNFGVGMNDGGSVHNVSLAIAD